MAARPESAAALHRQLKEEEEVRNELFASRGPTMSPAPSGGGAEEPTIDQLVTKAQRTHKDTTNTAQRALKVLEQSKQVQATTLNELDTQNKQLDGMNRKLNQMNQELTYSEKLLRYMRRCCCCWMCDSCTGADPEDRKRRKWERQVDKGKTAARDRKAETAAERIAAERRGTRDSAGSKAGVQAAVNGQGRRTTGASSVGGGSYTASGSGLPDEEEAGPSNGRPAGFRDPEIRLPEGMEKKELALHEETRKQNEILDQIHNGLGDLLDGAKRIGDELGTQTKALDALQGRTENTKGRLEDMNTKSQLKHFRVKKSDPKDKR